MFQTKAIEKIKTHILCSVTSFPRENPTVYEIKWKKNIHSRTGHGWQYGACVLHAG